MIDLLLEIWGFISEIASLFRTIYVFFHDGIIFAFRMISSCFKLAVGVFAGDMAFLFPLAGISLLVGFILVLTGRR